MNSIPMTVEGLKEQFEFYQRAENGIRGNLLTARRLLAAAARDRKQAYRRWQNKLKRENKP